MKPAICGREVCHVENLTPGQWYWFGLPALDSLRNGFGIEVKFKEMYACRATRRLCLLVTDRYECEQKFGLAEIGGMWELPPPCEDSKES